MNLVYEILHVQSHVCHTFNFFWTAQRRGDLKKRSVVNVLSALSFWPHRLGGQGAEPTFSGSTKAEAQGEGCSGRLKVSVSEGSCGGFTHVFKATTRCNFLGRCLWRRCY